jgi:hypothetical protein
MAQAESLAGGTTVAIFSSMKILWATDFTPRAEGAGRVAGELARMTGGSIEVAHVLAPRPADLLAIAADAGLMRRASRPPPGWGRATSRPRWWRAPPTSAPT